jgi:hypothetical protein
VAERVVEKLKNRMAVLRVGDPLDKNTDVGAINSKAQLEKIRSSSRPASGRAPTIYQPPVPLPARATGSRRRSSPASPRATGSPGRRSSARCSHPHVPHVDEAIEKANNTPTA